MSPNDVDGLSTYYTDLRRRFLAFLGIAPLRMLAQTRVDVPQQVRGAVAPNFADAEVPSGLINGTNAAFTLLHTPAGSSLQLYRNGIVQTAGIDYTLSGSAITFNQVSIPQTSDALIAWYRF